MAFNINHYIPKFILRNCCEEDSKKINLLDIINFSVYKESISAAFTMVDFYDIDNEQDPKILEKKFNQKLENLVAPIIKKILESSKNFKVFRYELELIKKYIAIQRYRNPSNQYFYTDNYNGPKFSNHSKFNIENDTDYWKREMLYILDNDWDTILNQDEFPGIKFICRTINSEYLTFFSTDAEFLISDINCFTERCLINIPVDDRENIIELSQAILKSQKLMSDQDISKLELGESDYFDNFTFVVLSPKLAVASVDSFWKMKYLRNIQESFFSKQIRSLIFENPKNFSLPIANYVNVNRMKTNADIIKHKDKNDEYLYEILNLTYPETIHVMILCLNEANLFLGYKNKEYLIDYIKTYNMLSSEVFNNIKNNYNGYVQLIENLSKIEI